MSFNSRYGRLAGFAAFGDVVSATEEVQAAQAKINSLNVQISNQKKLIDFTYQAQKNCAEGDAGTIVGNILTAGALAAVCMAEQTTALNQRKGVLGQLQLQLATAKGELTNANAALAQARANAAAGITPEVVSEGTPSAGGVSPVYGTSGSAMTAGGGGGLLEMISNPWVLGGAAVLGAGLIFALSRKG